MRKQLIGFSALFLLTLAAHAQTREAMSDGVWVTDKAGRYVRIEGEDGVVVEYLYDDDKTTTSSGYAVHIDGLVLTRMTTPFGVCAVPGLPKMTTRFDAKSRTAAVLADGTTVARVEYTREAFVSAIELPKHFTWRFSVANGGGRVQQVLENDRGRMMAMENVAPGFGRAAANYEAAARDIGVDLRTVTYEASPTNYVTRVRDKNGRVASYIVYGDRCDVGFSRTGKPLFYDLQLELFTGTPVGDSDLIVPDGWMEQNGTVPDRLVFTRSGAAGLYIGEPVDGAITSAWADRRGTVASSVAGDAEKPRDDH
ncbi:MAG TPA: hypothetical protein VND45_05210 [Thermoanaerobaculia bacterium]|jgi:hypothetical protein|nr:hypothetical protein [Thermoanaerobaculia bacterium]